ncbi:MAG: hypothetical protein RIR18_251 [Pseudomonadota bacterium]|jgi:flagellar hook protein FlgE
MLIGSAIALGLQGMMSGISRINGASAKIAANNIETDTANIAQAMIEQKIGETQVKASANVVKAGDEMIGTIIDIRV